MTTHIVTTHHGLVVCACIDAASAQEAIDQGAQDAGYKDEADMVERLGRPSEFVAHDVSGMTKDALRVQFGEIANILIEDLEQS